MKLSFDETLIGVWRQALVDEADVVKVGSDRYPVTQSKAKRLRQVAFVFWQKHNYGDRAKPQDQIAMGCNGASREESDAVYSGRPVHRGCRGWKGNYVRKVESRLRRTFFPTQALVTAYLLHDTVEIAATFLALFQEQVLSVKYDRLGALDLCEDGPVFRGIHDGKCITSGGPLSSVERTTGEEKAKMISCLRNG
jgi:hypothetical protein